MDVGFLVAELSKIDGALCQATLQFSSRLDAVVGCLTRQSELFHLVGGGIGKVDVPITRQECQQRLRAPRSQGPQPGSITTLGHLVK